MTKGLGFTCPLGLHVPAKYQHPVSGQERSGCTPGAVMLLHREILLHD